MAVIKHNIKTEDMNTEQMYRRYKNRKIVDGK